ncbi:MAG TPA: hypothetical protein VK821_17840 [Dehalococcoidia bacterium]|nr:hypothetical protein [Dehalococcoidia bacterium]
MPSQRIRRSVVLVLVTTGIWLAAMLALGRTAGAVASGDRYNLPLWIAGHLSRVWINPVARHLGGGFVPATDSQVLDFLGGSSAVAASERDLAFAEASDVDTEVAAKEMQRRIQTLNAQAWPVEDRLSGELASAIHVEALDTPLPAFTRIRVVWPPVAFAYDLPPYLLIQSPRDRIELEDTTLLRSDLSPSVASRLTGDVEASGASALVVRIGGLAAYPAVVEEDDSYSDALDLLAHEWTHQYLLFHPLGIRYFESRAMTTINETVANMVGRELAADLRERFPLTGTPERFRSSAPAPDPTINVDRVLHQLRLDVDALLIQGNIPTAEQRMADTRRFLTEHGYYLPPINQAYFAFYGAYADTAASTSPLGPRLASLRRLYPSLASFVRSVQDVRNAEDLTRLLISASG